MLITDKNEIVRLKLLYGPIHGFQEFVERYTVTSELIISILVLVKNNENYSIFLLEYDGKSVENKHGHGGYTGKEKFIKWLWKDMVADKKPSTLLGLDYQIK